MNFNGIYHRASDGVLRCLRCARWTLCLAASVVLVACDRYDLPSDRTGAFASCCGGQGTCLPNSLLESDVELLSRESCSPALLCVPNGFLAEGQAPPFASCRARGTGAEGRCLPDCLPDVRRQGERLGQDDCADQQRCVPCFDPLSGESTGACTQRGDSGPVEAPNVFATCCTGAGRCVPKELVRSEDRARLGQDSCAGETESCVPSAFVADASAVAASCVVSAFGAEGRCLPACLPDVRSRSDRLARDGCEFGELCTPCFDPFTGESTQACDLGADPGPHDKAVTFDACCGGSGACVPKRLLSSDERAHLGRDTCEGETQLCAPQEFLDPSYVPERCTVRSLGAEGRCLRSCLPEAASQADRFAQDGCATEHLCLPCFDPLSGEPTGVCTFGTDEGPSKPAVVFDSCANDQGRCLPDSLVPSEERARLGAATCARPEQLCVPSAWLDAAPVAPNGCRIESFGGEGRCLPNFLPEVASQLEQLTREDCGESQSCVPCFNPISGERTSACALRGDPGPSLPATGFSGCCGSLGRCVPRSLVPENAVANFGHDRCEGGEDFVCVAPASALLEQATYRPPSCHDAASGAEGRCLPACLPAVAAQARGLRQSGCEPHMLCVPCSDPLTGESTGACTQGSDPGPSEPPVVFEGCCGTQTGDLGVCLGRELLPAGTSQLARETCSDAEAKCVPRKLASSFGDVSRAGFAACSALTGRGACVRSCFLDSLTASLLSTSSCSSSEKCVPCVLNGAATGVCAP